MESTSVVSFVTRIGVAIDFSELFPTAKSAATISERKKRLIVNSPLNLCWWVAVLRRKEEVLSESATDHPVLGY